MDQGEARQEVITESVRGLFIINGGGAVALLAFLQAVWNEEPELAYVVLFGISFMGLGLVFASVVNYFRYHASWEKQSGNEPGYKRNKSIVMWCQKLSVASFVLAVAWLVIGSLNLLNCANAT